MKILISVVLVACWVATPKAMAQGAPAVHTLSVPHLTVQVSLTKNYAGQPMLIENFFTDDPKHHSVYCVSGLSDIRYVLKDASGKVIPINSQPNVPDIVAGEGGVGSGIPDQCKTVKADGAQRRVLLSNFYRELPHGIYYLELTLAPRGMTAHAVAAQPIIVKI